MQHVLGDANPAVAHAEHHFAVLRFDVYSDASTGLRVLKRVVHEVREHLRNPRMVAAHAERRGRQIHRKLVTVLIDELTVHFHRK